MIDPLVIAVAEADRLLALDDLDPIEDAAPDVAGPFEAVRSVAGDQNCVLTWLEVLPEPVVSRFPRSERPIVGTLTSAV
jgi:hypothetical protein